VAGLPDFWPAEENRPRIACYTHLAWRHRERAWSVLKWPSLL